MTLRLTPMLRCLFSVTKGNRIELLTMDVFICDGSPLSLCLGSLLLLVLQVEKDLFFRLSFLLHLILFIFKEESNTFRG